MPDLAIPLIWDEDAMNFYGYIPVPAGHPDYGKGYYVRFDVRKTTPKEETPWTP